jgi:predicted polyphosphate/ATP-dependent NAD kinase
LPRREFRVRDNLQNFGIEIALTGNVKRRLYESLLRSSMRIGFIVNPVAGMGGKVGLKGTDGILKEALAKGAVPVAPQRAEEFLKTLKVRLGDYQVELLCCPAEMGAQEAEAAGFTFQRLSMTVGEKTSSDDTSKAVKFLTDAKVDLIVFVGGDGTARDILDAINDGESPPVLGVPSGVKMYSGIFAINPRDAAEAVVAFLEHRAEVTDFEVMDADETAIRNDVFDVKLYGCIRGLSAPALIQGSKEVSPSTISEYDSQNAIAKYIIEELPKDATLILGPGTTVERIAQALGVKKTVLGVDLFQAGEVTLDVDERTLLAKVVDWSKTWIILSPIGHQGILLGRGNQQISALIVKRVGKKHVIVVATLNKLQGMGSEALRVDTGEEETNNLLRGSMLVVTGYREGVTVPVK